MREGRTDRRQMQQQQCSHSDRKLAYLLRLRQMMKITTAVTSSTTMTTTVMMTAVFWSGAAGQASSNTLHSASAAYANRCSIALTHQLLHHIRLTAFIPGQPGWAGTRKVNHFGFYWSERWWGGSGISWTICKSFAPRSRQITTPVLHHSLFTGRMPFLPRNQQRQSTDTSWCWWMIMRTESVSLMSTWSEKQSKMKDNCNTGSLNLAVWNVHRQQTYQRTCCRLISNAYFL